jgi:hypothetical protein
MMRELDGFAVLDESRVYARGTPGSGDALLEADLVALPSRAMVQILCSPVQGRTP